jgi:hypothetical protein
MKLEFLSFLTVIGAVAALEKREECEKCVEQLDEAKECLRICNDKPLNATLGLAVSGSLLNDCLDPSRDGGSIDSLDSLVECCDLENACEKEFEDAQECVQLCFDPCIKTSSQAYLDCIEEENDGIDAKCSRQACLDGFLEDLEDDADFSGDFLDLKNLQKRLEKIEQDDLQDCSLVSNFVDAACDISNDCCKKCDQDLAVVLDCLVNDIVIPFTAIELNTTIDECVIDANCGLVTPPSTRARRTTQEEEVIFSKALNLPKSKRDPAREAAIREADKNRVLETTETNEEAVEKCERGLQLNTVTHNVTYAVNVFMECVSSAFIAALPDEDVPKAQESAAPVFKLAVAVATMVGTLFAL